MPDQLPPLQYQQRGPVIRRKRVNRVLTAIVLIVVGMAGYRLGPAIYHRMMTLYFQRQCMNYELPYAIPARSFFLGNDAACWLEYSRLNGYQTSASYPIVYMHERKTPAGERMLVLVRARGGNPSNIPKVCELVLSAAAIRPATPFRPADMVIPIQGSSGLAQETIVSEIGVEQWSSRSDEDDSSHFIIELAPSGHYPGRRTTIDGWLKNDGSVLMEPRPVEIIPPPTSSPASSP